MLKWLLSYRYYRLYNEQPYLLVATWYLRCLSLQSTPNLSTLKTKQVPFLLPHPCTSLCLSIFSVIFTSFIGNFSGFRCESIKYKFNGAYSPPSTPLPPAGHPPSWPSKIWELATEIHKSLGRCCKLSVLLYIYLRPQANVATWATWHGPQQVALQQSCHVLPATSNLPGQRGEANVSLIMQHTSQGNTHTPQYTHTHTPVNTTTYWLRFPSGCPFALAAASAR